MDSRLIREKYFRFFERQGHKRIDPAPLVLENDPTTLFTSAGMQPLVPYLKGLRTHPGGGRLVNSQPSFRSQDIEEVGDNRHITFFEMLGNWSLGDYFKKEQLSWVWEFLTKELEIVPEKLYVSIYEGSDVVPGDTESLELWKSLGVEDSHIYKYPGKKNWWSLSGTPETMIPEDIGGPDSEVFYEFDSVTHNPKFGDQCHPNCDCGRFLEIGNSVFIQYQKQADGSLKELPNKNVDFGGGLERLVAATENQPDIFLTSTFKPIMDRMDEEIVGPIYQDPARLSEARIVVDHIRSAAFLIKDGVHPGNKMHAYIVRRLLRRAAVKTIQLGKGTSFHLDWVTEVGWSVAQQLIKQYDEIGYFTIADGALVESTIGEEMVKFKKAFDAGMKIIETEKNIGGKEAFDLYQTYGFPIEITAELIQKRGETINLEDFYMEFEKHKTLSRTASVGMFKGGLASTGQQETKYHTATHLLHRALRTILGDHVIQRGSNITAERMRFDFAHNEKLTAEQIKSVEDLVNQKIVKDLPVSFYETTPDQARTAGAIGAFGERYGDKVKVYSIGEFSKEICGGPHVEHTGILGHFKIEKQESASSGIRRIYASLS
ncbi:hypothetical protein A2631_04480 [Candidatus Daviesbacteria bacterium RIFCSPHIGHO2_01_FULL_44_29]|uniref:alanine--tRNA ligase n=1 Tax=Candidatus Daviesbacteria bacterium RIFCSPHIGHO2_02_FULL_43_12 TaxID=1797776 RepID=A0A1F5KGK0_9BACT|nr:MAG: hypothetical protein A2631_04480 [Candidatus Daviesbacteria bacterium RIFCSPHIGHO2_01_FULL_44_29]OGE39630.1 MAG: hypothetical protein A3E86_03435 [Candidatus Daviesbacteria bacterium RIFCSPHIGHO2_12_FULL_47_45]OGE39979.1 MAG: hypothetical protein A3D25_04210 [Candidatus Daviesbacteria bacterium RIFCSPHIGHO2_02_FULL_43_12]OGE70340.1 MAG: hypothetical protein A3B55_01360 [Candidatus Daviesbacteria bacterium RIFCSPLOWO2_01_FULL_43_15]